MEFFKIKESVDYIKNKVKCKPNVCIILGSGLGELADEIENKIIIKYSDIPNMPQSTVKGHKGQFVFGKLFNKNIVAMQGRFHYYEGNKMELLSLPIYILKNIGVEKIIVTNAAGGVNTKFVPGDFMIIADHINFAFDNPLIGKNDERLGTRFPDMSQPYNREFIDIAKNTAKEIGLNIRQGVYFMMSGPTYETPAEVKMIRKLGGDAVGMSTVPEVIAANHCGMKVLGISCITNMAAGILNKPLTHSEVMETSERVKSNFSKFVKSIIKNI